MGNRIVILHRPNLGVDSIPANGAKIARNLIQKDVGLVLIDELPVLLIQKIVLLLIKLGTRREVRVGQVGFA
mgnify:CR=1 FL=1